MADTPSIAGAKRVETAAREARLSRALRDNLRRRKEQARARESGPGRDAVERSVGVPNNQRPGDKPQA